MLHGVLVASACCMRYLLVASVCCMLQERTNDSLQVMGTRLSAEINEKLAAHAPHGPRRPVSALSFVGHSLGNLIIRAALQTPEVGGAKMNK